MVGASANTDFKSVLCFIVFLVNLTVLLYIYVCMHACMNNYICKIISDTPRAKPTRVVACLRQRDLIYIKLGGVFE